MPDRWPNARALLNETTSSRCRRRIVDLLDLQEATDHKSKSPDAIAQVGDLVCEIDNLLIYLRRIWPSRRFWNVLSVCRSPKMGRCRISFRRLAISSQFCRTLLTRPRSWSSRMASGYGYAAKASLNPRFKKRTFSRKFICSILGSGGMTGPRSPDCLVQLVFEISKPDGYKPNSTNEVVGVGERHVVQLLIVTIPDSLSQP